MKEMVLQIEWIVDDFASFVVAQKGYSQKSVYPK